MNDAHNIAPASFDDHHDDHDLQIDDHMEDYHFGPVDDSAFGPQMSTHGMVLNDQGGNVAVADGIDAELAAAAVDANTVVIQHNGESYYAPID